MSSPWITIPNLIEAINFANKMVESCFNDNTLIAQALKNALSSSINGSKRHISFLLVRHLSVIVEANRSEFPRVATEYEPALGQIDEGLYIFRLIEGKQDFENIYKDQLARRLLLGVMFSEMDGIYFAPLNIPLEKYIIFKLKGECGISFTFKLEGMLRDISLSLKYRKSLNPNTLPILPSQLKPCDISTSLSILTPNFWPAIDDAKMSQRILRHPVFGDAMWKFANEYRTMNQGRHLKFSMKNSICVVEVTFPYRETFSLICSVYQAMVLEPFSSGETFSFSKLEKMSGLTKDDLAMVLESLIQKKILLQSSTSFFLEDASFSANQSINEMDQKIVNVLTGMYSSPDHLLGQHLVNPISENPESFSAENIYRLDAAIVRILKHQRGPLSQSTLFKMVLDSLRLSTIEANHTSSNPF